MVIFIPSRRGDGAPIFKICIYGPPESGRKTVLKWLHGHLGKKSKIEELKDETGSTLFFDAEYGKTTTVKFQIYTSQSQTVLKGTDAVIFTWDSLIDRWGGNISSLKDLLRFYGDKLIPAFF